MPIDLLEEAETGNTRLRATFETADVRHETAQLRCAAWCDICGVAMRRAPCGMRFKWWGCEKTFSYFSAVLFHFSTMHIASFVLSCCAGWRLRRQAFS